MVSECNFCGLCKAECPVYKVTLSETTGPRGRALMKDKGITSETFYLCTLCNACEQACPAGVSLELREFRKKIVKAKKETEANKVMIENIKRYGNPFGKFEKGKKPKELYCC